MSSTRLGCQICKMERVSHAVGRVSDHPLQIRTLNSVALKEKGLEQTLEEGRLTCGQGSKEGRRSCREFSERIWNEPSQFREKKKGTKCPMSTPITFQSYNVREKKKRSFDLTAHNCVAF